MANAQIKVLSNGNMGIGVTNPTYKLEVNGGASFTVFPSTGAKFILGTYSYLVSSSPYSFLVTAPALYPGTNNSICIGIPDAKINTVYTYTVNYQTLVNSSDMRLKENIRLCPSFLSKLKDIKSYNYNYKDEYFKDFSPEEKAKAQKTEFGFLAQEVQKIFPELVFEDNSTGMLSLNYVGMIPILTSAINELQQEKESQQSTIEKLQQKVESLEKALNACCKPNQPKSMPTGENGNIQEFNFTDSANPNTDEMKIYQNAPNPFNTTTTIECYIPQTIQKVELCVYNMHGVQIKCLPVSERGTVHVQIQAGQLSAGVYAYFLTGDDKMSDAKQMILTK